MRDVKLLLGDCLEILPTLGHVDAVVTDPPYGMKWNTDSTRYSGGKAPNGRRSGDGRADYGPIESDATPFDPSPWLSFRKLILWGANHYAAEIPVGTTLVWLKKADHLLGTFLSDAEVGWMKGGHGVYCFRKPFPPPTRMVEAGVALVGKRGARSVHPTQKPVGLMRWCIERLKLKPGATILDPYMGSGSTGVAAVELGYRFIGIEKHAPYFAVAERRLAEVAVAC